VSLYNLRVPSPLGDGTRKLNRDGGEFHHRSVMELARMASSITTEIIFCAITLSGITYYIHNTWLVCV
jgi:hypothetical protein